MVLAQGKHSEEISSLHELLCLLCNWKGTIPRGNDPQGGPPKVVGFGKGKAASRKGTKQTPTALGGLQVIVLL